ncbi:glucose PTS transporter subunit IIA [Enterococcus hulanensis]|uniref:Glucose PTS transporter subunit IIA n=1 Tax=Enterococcus hulanensis TaxID=2559929 RepID=A0ABU3F1V4_9ENTE|nr:glucose PTS transporter subunit IIA [Enterococcus hulanensis]MDT2601114.1 glucose PTS transporter subunit IIA [Enterococcus hulanensis]MDT2610404.1 glucose PTS transporter subunit IIA [Enterococcus hulanensis]MDT2617131.1 glucose PTS transporter subunit IIA [Enterococcus hulanensis]MDT2628349.1 glucose PTS transporter subunit IIA [Enterococcus hulanensis]MDT2655454.1 glucose PTS transporter subunit IIA [Enterococcus hulanensis]
MNNRDLAKAILKEVGGEKNISSYTNCITRLRFQLKDNEKVDQQAIDALDGVLGSQFQSGQFQVILGGKVVNVTNEFSELVDLPDESDKEADEGNKGILSNILNTLSSILTPALPPVIAGGLLKGFIFMFQNFGWVNGSSDSLIFFNGLADSMFYFFPFLLAVSSARKFKTNEYLALTLAGLLMYPFAFADGQTMIKLFGFIPLAVVNYSASVLPIIFSVWLLKYVKRFFDQRIPEMVNMVFSPLLSLLIVAPIAMVVLAPLGYYIGEYIAAGVKWLIDFSPWLAGLIVGGTRPILVLGGMHHAMNPIMQQEVSSFGSSQMLAMVLMSTLAQATAPLVVYFKEKNIKEKQVALSAVIPGYVGITEPAIYGVLVRYKGAMIAACVGGGVGAAISTMLGGRSFGFVMPGLLSLPAFMGEGFIGVVIGCLVSVIVTALLTFVLMDRFKKEKKVNKAAETVTDLEPAITVSSPVVGEQVPLDRIEDATFSKEILGATAAIQSADGRIYAPMAATVKAVFPTKHAIGLALENGVELLIHIGLDTVSMNGEGFELNVQQGDLVQKGDVLLTFDQDLIKSKQLNDVIIVVITNTETFGAVRKNENVSKIDLNQNLFDITK